MLLAVAGVGRQYWVDVARDSLEMAVQNGTGTLVQVINVTAVSVGIASSKGMCALALAHVLMLSLVHMCCSSSGHSSFC